MAPFQFIEEGDAATWKSIALSALNALSTALPPAEKTIPLDFEQIRAQA
jgi:hypothetical protein